MILSLSQDSNLSTYTQNMLSFGVVLVSLITFIVFTYFFVKRRYSYWTERNVLHVKPKFPLGNLQGIGTTKHTADITRDFYLEHVGKAPFLGVYFFLDPVVIPLDPVLIKNIMVRDFNYFHDRGFYYNDKSDPLSAILFALEGERWKKLRNKLSPTFTSGKMKLMFEAVREIANKMSIKFNDCDGKKVDIKDLLSRFSIDVIGMTVFGIDVNSLDNPNVEFCAYSELIVRPPKWQQLKATLLSSYPKLGRLLGLRIFNKSATEFFYQATKEVVDYRIEHKIKKNDFLQMLSDLGDGVEKLDMNEIAAQTFQFFIAGSETSSTTMQFFLYELAKNQEIQNRVRNEITSMIKSCDDKLTYESTCKMSYFDKCIHGRYYNIAQSNTCVQPLIIDITYFQKLFEYILLQKTFFVLQLKTIQLKEQILSLRKELEYS